MHHRICFLIAHLHILQFDQAQYSYNHPNKPIHLRINQQNKIQIKTIKMEMKIPNNTIEKPIFTASQLGASEFISSISNSYLDNQHRCSTSLQLADHEFD